MTTIFNYKIYAQNEIAPSWLSEYLGTIEIEKTPNSGIYTTVPKAIYHSVYGALLYDANIQRDSISTSMKVAINNAATIQSAMNIWGSYLDINFSTGAGAKSIAFGGWKPISGFGSATTFVATGSHVGEYAVLFNMSVYDGFNNDAVIGNWGGWSVMHEFIHILSGQLDIGESPDLRQSILYYPTRINGVIDPNVKIPLTPGMSDIFTLQGDYGVSHAQDGDTVYKFTQLGTDVTTATGSITLGNAATINNNPYNHVMTLWDRPSTNTDSKGGIDTIDASGVDTNVYINLNGGHFSAIGTNVNTPLADGVNGNTDYNVGIAIDAEIENAKGGSGADYLKGNDLANTLEGNAGNDTLEGGKGNDILKGGSGNDTYKLDGTYGIDTIEDSDGTIIVDGQTLSGGEYKFESIYKNEGTTYQYIKVNGGADLLVLKQGDANRIIINNWSTGQLGINLADSALAAPTGNVMNGDFKKKIIDDGISAPIYVIENNNYVDGGAEVGALDVINGTPNVDIIKGLGGSDFISGAGGNDYIEGGEGGDFIQGGLGADTIYGGNGDDLIYAGTRVELGPTVNTNFTPPTARYSVIVATGFNWVFSTSVIAENGVGIDGWINIKGGNEFLGDAAFGGDDVTNLIDGGGGNDYILGGIGGDYLLGGTGKDFILGHSGDDIILGGDGNDYINGDLGYIDLANGNGNDVIDGGSGVDIIIAEGGNDIVFGGSENDFLWGDYEDETASGGNDLLVGGAGNDQLVGGGGNDTLIGGTGTDSLFGGSGNDYLDGGADGSNDVLSGEAGDDTIVGGEGADTLSGGAGADTIYASDADTLSGQDKDDKIVFLGGGNATIAAVSTNAILGGAAVTLNLGTASINLLNGLVGKDDATFTFADGTQIKQSELIGTRLNSEVNIASASNAIFGGMLDDNLQATGTADSALFGGLGNDILIGSAGNNSPFGKAANDNHWRLIA